MGSNYHFGPYQLDLVCGLENWLGEPPQPLGALLRSITPTGKGTSAAGGGGGKVLEDTGPDASICSTCCESGDESSFQTISRKRLRHMSANVETDDDDDEFAAELHDRLLEESMYQQSLESFTAWSMDANGLLGF